MRTLTQSYPLNLCCVANWRLARHFFISAQILGGICGVWLTHAMFDQSIFHLSQTDRSGPNLWIPEVFASTGLLCVIFGGLARNPKAIPTLVGVYISGAY